MLKDAVIVYNFLRCWSYIKTLLHYFIFLQPYVICNTVGSSKAREF